MTLEVQIEKPREWAKEITQGDNGRIKPQNKTADKSDN